ncbi:MAG: hypothetical protein COV44_10365 [Deltaproteobacteria bacterium CG11_big_fil_rev_8_21_14_0_20_45_16]|nr:MAG: hypothetical protein COV44_10365 [Deltaproteobacteria bacterium CG11_big_fil_rev_8_21_14_0_20_45_16]
MSILNTFHSRASAVALHQDLILEVETLLQGRYADALAVCGDQRIYVLGALQGEKLKVQLLDEFRPGQWKAKILEIMEASTRRRKAACQHFDDCGACQIQHWNYDYQIEWKHKMLLQLLENSSLGPKVQELKIQIMAAPSEYFYRQHARLSIADNKPAFFKAGSRVTVGLNECPVMSHALFAYACEKASGRETSSSMRILDPIEFEGLSFEFIQGNRIPVSPASFIQPNLAVARMIGHKLEKICSESSQKRLALDLFCGSGNFTSLIAKYFSKVLAVDECHEAIELARQTNPSIEWVAGKTDDFLKELFERPKQPLDFCFLDPPRNGAFRAMEDLKNLKPTTVAYLSCQPDSLVRDLTRLVKNDHYRIQDWIMIDLLPQTRHIENLVILKIS